MSPSIAERLFPRPRRCQETAGRLRPRAADRLTYGSPPGTDGRAAALLARGLASSHRSAFACAPVDPPGEADVVLAIAPSAGPAQGYRLTVTPTGITIEGADAAGLFYGVCTLLQLVRPEPGDKPRRLELPTLEIEDAPDFERRGLMLDVSRDRVPTLATLEELAERLARWKINELQLYTEHTFAYAPHEAVWHDASPLTADEVRRLGAFCAERHIDLVPNQQSLGHFHRWLVHDAYRHLAECPEGVAHPFATEPEPFSLAPTSPDVLPFVTGLHDELLQAYDSPYLNVGLDETFDIGLGASETAVRERGKGRVYLEYLTRLHASVTGRGIGMQFWGDVILEHPELVPELPRDAIALAWGYEAGHPFEEQTQRFADAGLPFYVCPGTSTWLSLAGRLTNARSNLESAARSGLRAGARGFLVTDWGDYGHWQPLPASWAPLLDGACRAWNVDAAPVELDDAVDREVFGRAAGAASLGRVWTGMAELYRASGARAINGSPLFFLLRFAHEGWPHARIEDLTVDGLERSRAAIEDLARTLEDCAPTAADGPLALRETRWVLDALGFTCALGEARLALGPERPLSALEASDKRALADGWRELTDRLPELWLARSRPGGLEHSIARFEPFTRLLGL